MALQLYAVYARCTHCGIYDRDPEWCALCGRPKDGAGAPRGNGGGADRAPGETARASASAISARQKSARP
jgi:hypothetical protein